MSVDKDYYAILGIQPDTPLPLVKSAYKRLVQKYHPDKFTSPRQKAEAEAKIKLINEAYAVLSNARKRREYDENRKNEHSYHQAEASRQSHSSQQESVKPQPKANAYKSDWENKDDKPHFETNKGKVGSPISIMIGVLFIIWLIDGKQEDEHSVNQPPSTLQVDSPRPNTSGINNQNARKTQEIKLYYAKPLAGSHQFLSISEIHWCLRENIRIEAMRGIVKTRTGVNELNQIINDYNLRCVSYKYDPGAFSLAERHVDSFRNTIISEAIAKARQFDQTDSPVPMDKPATFLTNKQLDRKATLSNLQDLTHQDKIDLRSKNSINKPSSNPLQQSTEITTSTQYKPSTRFTLTAQQILTHLGYQPGPIDGQYGPQTIIAVKAFQYDNGLSETGRINEDLIDALRKANATHKQSVIHHDKPQIPTATTQQSKISTTFSIGSRLEDVLKIQPNYSFTKEDQTSKSIYFGSSIVKFSKTDQKVIAWYNWGNNLKVRIRQGQNTTASKTIDIHSHADDVIRLHGQPKAVVGQKWFYGYAKSYIFVSAKTNRVEKWVNKGDLKTEDRTFFYWD